MRELWGGRIEGFRKVHGGVELCVRILADMLDEEYCMRYRHSLYLNQRSYDRHYHLETSNVPRK